MLLIGPSRIFLRYIEQVLPALGEHTVNLATPADLVPTPVRGQDEPAAARLKGDARMARVVAQAVRDRERGLPAADQPCCGRASGCACRCATPGASSSRSSAGGARTTSGGPRWSAWSSAT